MSRIFGPVLGNDDDPPPLSHDADAGRRAAAPVPLPLTRARAAELRGELSLAAALYAEAGRPEEVARVVVLRGDAEREPAARLRHYAHAVAGAPLGSAVHALARRKHAATVVAMTAGAPLTTGSRYDLGRAAAELESLEDYAGAAAAYALAGDIEGHARVLAHAGDVDGLEALLSEEQRRDRDASAVRRARDEFAMLVASGQRREAVDTVRTSADQGLRSLGSDLARRRVGPGVVRAVLPGDRGKAVALVLGEEVILGRDPEEPGAPARVGVISVAAPLVSRRHVAIERIEGGVWVRDLGSRHGTFYRGRPLPAAGARLPFAAPGHGDRDGGVEFQLGREVRVVVRPTTVIAGAVAIETGGTTFVAPLGPAHLGVGRWRMERAEDGWVELATDDDPPAFAGLLRLGRRVTLLAGDAIARGRGDAAVLEILEHGA